MKEGQTNPANFSPKQRAFQSLFLQQLEAIAQY